MTEEDLSFDLSKKKKKKKSAAQFEPDLDPEAEAEAEIARQEAGNGVKCVPDMLEAENGAEEDELGDFTGKKKKKGKGKKAVAFDGEEPEAKEEKEHEEENLNEEESADEDEEYSVDDSAPGADITFEEQPPLDPDQDYPYPYLLSKISDLLRANNPELGGERKKFSLKPPQIVKEGTKKVVFTNFPEICSLMHRSPDHVLSYMLAELGTSGSLDGSQRLVIKGKFNPKQLENVLRRYVGEFVACQMCKSFYTTLTRDPVSRLFFLKCDACKSTRSVQVVKQGFMAQVGKRRNKK